MNKEWISVNDRLPETHLAFETMLETQYISDRVVILSNPDVPWRNEKGLLLTEPVEVEVYYVERQAPFNAGKMWSLSSTGDSMFFEINAATHWRYKS
jgi:hypothetical protein